MRSLIRMVAIDIDGTLLGANHRIPPENIAEIRRIIDQGVEVVLATGRTKESIGDFISQLDSRIHVVSDNGALALRVNRSRPLVDETIPLGISKEVLSELSRFNRYFYVDTSGGITVGDSVATPRKGKSFADIAVDDIPLYLEKTGQLPRKICSMGTLEELLSLKQYIFERWGNRLVTYVGGHGGLEIGPEGTSKKIAVKALAASFGFTLKEVMALGDGHNDIDLVREAGYGVAMGNAVGPLKEVARYSTFPNHQAGVAKAIRRFIPEDEESEDRILGVN